MGERQVRDPEPLDNAWYDPVHLVVTGVGTWWIGESD
jgi:hypothetical protein